jgi:hypothetical protein
MPLLTELILLGCRNYKDFAPTELVIAPLKQRPSNGTFFNSLLSNAPLCWFFRVQRGMCRLVPEGLNDSSLA